MMDVSFMYIINKIPHGKWGRTVYTHSLFLRHQKSNERAQRTSEIRQQLVCKYRTPSLSMKYSIFITLGSKCYYRWDLFKLPLNLPLTHLRVEITCYD